MTDALAIMVFAVVESGSLLPFESHSFGHISDQIIRILTLLETDRRPPV